MIKCIGVVGAMMLATQLYAHDIKASYNAGESSYFEKGCSSCHGPQAEGSGSNPTLVHKNRDYLIQRLRYFRSGAATSSTTQQMMAQFAQTLSDKQINDIATFLSRLQQKEYDDVPDELLGGVGS